MERLRLRNYSKYAIVRWLIFNKHLTHTSLLRIPTDQFVLELLDSLGWHFLSNAEIEAFVENLRRDCAEVVGSPRVRKELRKQDKLKLHEAAIELRRHKKAEKAARRALRATVRTKPRYDPGYSAREYREFLNSDEWRRLRYDVLRQTGGTCCLCGRSRKGGVVIHVDHVVPASVDWSRRMDVTNLQSLCEDCNLGKSNSYSDDWR
jgi:5-methylcytosine-specific restriction endonuclease McrA